MAPGSYEIFTKSIILKFGLKRRTEPTINYNKVSKVSYMIGFRKKRPNEN